MGHEPDNRGGDDRRRSAGRRPGEDRYVNIEKAIPVWVVGTALTVGGMLTGYVTAQDSEIRERVRAVMEKNHEQDIAVRELQVRMDQMLIEQKRTNVHLDKISESLQKISDVVRVRRGAGELPGD